MTIDEHPPSDVSANDLHPVEGGLAWEGVLPYSARTRLAVTIALGPEFEPGDTVRVTITKIDPAAMAP